MAPKLPSASYAKPTKKGTAQKPRPTATKAKAAKTTAPRKRDKEKAVAMAVAVRELVEQVQAGTVGRPEDYKPQYTLLAEKLCLLNVGITDPDLAQFFEVSEATIHNWKKSHPEFLEAIRNGKDISDLNVAHALYRRATGATYIIEKEVKRKVTTYCEKNPGKKLKEEEFIEVVPLIQEAPPDAVAGKYWMNNRRRHEAPGRQWVDKVELTHEGGDKPIQHDVNVNMGFARKVAFIMEKAARAKLAQNTEEAIDITPTK